MPVCLTCKKTLIPLDISYSLKILGRSSKKLYCTECLRKSLNLTEEDMQNLYEKWKAEGCMLFQFD